MGFNLNKTIANHAHAKAHPLAHIDHSLADYEREMKERDALMKQVEAPDLVEYVHFSCIVDSFSFTHLLLA